MMGISSRTSAHKEVERVLERAREEERVATDAELSADAMGRVVDEYEALIERETGAPFPQDP
jgi:pyruvate,orthophosphate dikinase